MSDQGFRVQITDLYLSAPTFSNVGYEISDEVTQVQRQLDGLGAFWGNDAPGQSFASSYVPDQAKLLQLMSTVANAVKGVSDGITAMADKYRINEEQNLGRIRALEQEEQGAP
jgi:uncharacterized protein YukE